MEDLNKITFSTNSIMIQYDSKRQKNDGEPPDNCCYTTSYIYLNVQISAV